MKERRWVLCSQVSSLRAICMVLIPLAVLFLSAAMSASAQPTQASGTSVSTTESKGVVTGKVVDVEGNALAQVEVTALDSNSFEAAQVYTATGDTTVGQFSIGLDPGSYRLEFKKRGYEFRTLSVSVVSDKVGYLPDVVLDYSLRVSLSATSVRVDAGDLVEVSVTISNTGFEAETCSVNISAPEGWTARLQSGDVSVLGFTLDPSESKTYALKVEPPYSSASGQVALAVFGWTTHQETLTVVVDVSEEEHTLLSATQVALKGSPGETVQFGVNVANPFSEELDIGLAVEVPQGWQGSLDAPNGAKISGLTLSPFEVYSANLVVKIPSFAEPTAYEIGLTAMSGSIDDRLVLLLEVEGMKQRMLTAKYPVVEGAPGGRAEFDVEVVNLLEEKAVFEVELTAPAGWEGEVTGPEGGTLLAVTLGAGEVLHAAVVLEIPDDASPGMYEALLVVSSGTLREELTLKAQIVKGEAHVELSTGTPFLDAYSGSDAIFNLKIKNRGAADGVVDIQVDELPSGFSYLIEDSEGNIVSSIYLLAGEEKILRLDVKVSPTAEPSPVDLSVTAVSGESSDALSLRLNILGSYELGYVTRSFYVEAMVGETVPFELVVENNGYNIVNNLEIEITDMPEDFNVTLTPKILSLLQPGASAVYTVQIEIPPDIDAGDYYVSLQAKSDQVTGAVRSVHLEVAQRGEVAYLGLVLIVIIVASLVVVYWRFGRR